MITAKDIKVTEFEYEHYLSEKRGNSTHGEYMFHNFDIYNQIIIKGRPFHLNYQTGISYDYGDYNYPSNSLSLSVEGGSGELMFRIDEILESEFDKMDSDDEEALVNDFKEYFSEIESIDCIRNIWNALRDNEFNANHEYQSLEL